MDRDSVIGRLLTDNEEFRLLRTEHQTYDQELEHLRRQSPLTPDQQWRMSELKKLKLIAKDRMEAIIRHTQPSVTA